MGSMQQALPSDSGRKKKAEDFLGANANLVNLDQLVSKQPAKGQELSFYLEYEGFESGESNC